MFDPAAAQAEARAFLPTVPLLEGMSEMEIAELAQIMRRQELPVGEVLWRDGDEVKGMLLIVDGRVSVSVPLPGDRVVEVTSLGAGEVLGEVPLIDGGQHSATAAVAEPATLLSLSRADFAALVSRRHPTAFALKRRIARVACARLRGQLAALATSLGGDAPPEPPADEIAEFEFRGPPDSKYVRRLAAFHDFDSLALWGFLTAGRYALCPPGRTLITEGTPSTACFVMINGAVEKVIIRGDRRIRVSLVGPGHAFGYETLIDGGPSSVTATTRERTLLLVLPQEPFERMFNGEDNASHAFLDVILRDLMANLRQVLRPHARLALS
jgi:CRP/FNR family transcriptional regulator, cyclic AMP receptor protein